MSTRLHSIRVGTAPLLLVCAAQSFAQLTDQTQTPHLEGAGIAKSLEQQIGEGTSDSRTPDSSTYIILRDPARAMRARAIDEAKRRCAPVSVELESKGIHYGSLRALPDGEIDTSGVRGVNPDLRVRPFFAQGGTISIREFIVGALNDEMGLQAVDPATLRAAGGKRVATPTGMVLDGGQDLVQKGTAESRADDPDGDGVTNEIPAALVDVLEFNLVNYFKPATYRQSALTKAGLALMEKIGCTDCHVQNLSIERDRRVADVETVYDPQNGGFNDLFATALLLVVEEDDGSGHPTLKRPADKRFVVRNFFADMRRHDHGPAFHERNYDGSYTKEFMTEPRWGVGSTPPYGHDGRSTNLREVILRHGGEAQKARNAFAVLPESGRSAILEFLGTFVLFPPDDTASNLDPGDPSADGYPQHGHGGINLTELFNDPGDRE